ncbi:MAG: hypothetical protein P4M11_12025 [Candidatus Pacebacteria bacterium]|nr:hypothetical protein [Candidatus Paceibacterota bacterium]
MKEGNAVLSDADSTEINHQQWYYAQYRTQAFTQRRLRISSTIHAEQ